MPEKIRLTSLDIVLVHVTSVCSVQWVTEIWLKKEGTHQEQTLFVWCQVTPKFSTNNLLVRHLSNELAGPEMKANQNVPFEVWMQLLSCTIQVVWELSSLALEDDPVLCWRLKQCSDSRQQSIENNLIKYWEYHSCYKAYDKTRYYTLLQRALAVMKQTDANTWSSVPISHNEFPCTQLFLWILQPRQVFHQTFYLPSRRRFCASSWSGIICRSWCCRSCQSWCCASCRSWCCRSWCCRSCRRYRRRKK